MLTKSHERNREFLIVALCWVVYFSSYLTRQDYNAALTPMLVDLRLPKSALSLAGTGCFLFYGAGQLICGLLLRRVSARRMIFCGLWLSVTCNLGIPGATLLFPVSVYPKLLPIVMTILWSINGFAQAMLWPSMVQILIRWLSPERYTRACVKITIASAFGTVCVYALSALLIRYDASRWRFLFVICAAVALLTSIFWKISCPKTDPPPLLSGTPAPASPQVSGAAHHQEHPAPPGKLTFWSLLTKYGLFPLLLATLLHGILRDGVTAWMPVMIREGYPSFSNAKSVFTAAVLPLTTAVSVQISGRIGRAMHHEVRSAALFFGFGAVSAGALAWFQFQAQAHKSMSSGHLLGSILAMACVIAAMNGFNLMIVCHLPARFAGQGSTGLAAGLVNSFTYLGSAISMFGIALLAEQFGWRVTTLVWCSLAALATIICILCTRKVVRILQI